MIAKPTEYLIIKHTMEICMRTPPPHLCPSHLFLRPQISTTSPVKVFPLPSPLLLALLQTLCFMKLSYRSVWPPYSGISTFEIATLSTSSLPPYITLNLYKRRELYITLNPYKRRELTLHVFRGMHAHTLTYTGIINKMLRIFLLFKRIPYKTSGKQASGTQYHIKDPFF